MSTKLLTNLLFEPKGVHDPALTYSIKDTVMSPDGSKVYFALRDVPSGIALTDEDYWMLQIDLSGSKNAMDEAVAAFADYAKIVGTRVKGETAKAAGNPVSFLPDAGSLLQPVTVLEPQQEGSGDPYPAGGGKNLLKNTATTQVINGVTFTVNSDGTVLANGTATADAILIIDRPTLPAGEYIASGCPANGDASSRHSIYFGVSNGFDYGIGHQFTLAEETNLDYVRIIIRNGYTASNLVFKPMIRLASDPDSTYAPYSNIRPIIGYDKLDLNHAGKNLLPNNSSTQTINGITFTVNRDGSITANGTATANAILTLVSSNSNPELRNVLMGNQITISGCPSGGSSTTYDLRIFQYADANTFLMDYGSGITATFTNAELPFNVAILIRSGVSVSNLVFRPQIELGSTASDFQPYTNTLHTVQIGQTVYGGKYDWLTGKLVAEWAMATLTGDENITTASTNTSGKVMFNYALPGAKPNTGNAIITGGILCSHYTEISPNGAYSRNTGAAIGLTGLLSIYDSTYAGLALDAFKAYLAAQYTAGTPVQIAYKLATPIEIQLTPHIIQAVEPEQNNTLYGDGTIEVEYVKPLHVSIEERVAAIASAMLMKEE